ncbi:hypothetical protein PINS_up005022 [Pythium insidiosum]|nr:hypothetical protein PINS_up005022 [Pythium insidiosum]
MKPHAPRGPSTAVSGIFFLLGIASSLPWNVFVTEQDYFRMRLQGTAYEDSFVNWFSTALNITTLLTMLVRTVCIADRMPSAVKTVFASLVVVLSVMLGHTVLTRMPEFHGEPFFQLTMVSLVVVGAANSMVQDGLLRLVSTFPPRFTQAVVSGQAMAGVVVASSNLIIMAANQEPTPTDAAPLFFVNWDTESGADLSAFVYFVFVFAVVLLSVLAFIALTRMELFRFYHYHHAVPHKDTARMSAVTTDMEDQDDDESMASSLLSRHDRAGSASEEEEEERELYLVELVYKIRFYGAAIFLVFMVSLAAFPGLTSLLHSSNPARGRLYRDLFVPALFVVVNVSDLVGRWTANWWPVLSGRQLFGMTVLRSAFIPLLMLCNLQNNHNQVITRVVFHSDVFPLLFVVVLLYSNGVLFTQSLMRYPSVLRGAKEKEMGGTIMFFLLTLGLTTGSLVTFVLYAMLRP